MNHFKQSLRERDGSLVNHWYIACLSSELHEKPIRRIIYDTPLVLFRNKNKKPSVLLDWCLHRGVKLSEGTCHNGNLRCPYHGWTYDEQGNVCEIPSEGGTYQQQHEGQKNHRPLSKRVWESFEQDGVIWVWMGDDKPLNSPNWKFPNYNQPQWTHYFMVTDFENEVTHLAENFMDVPHTVFVHRGWFRNRKLTHVPMTVDVKEGQVLVTYHQPKDAIGASRWIMNPKNDPMTHTDCFVFPNITRVDYRFGESSWFIVNSQCTPISTMKTRVYTYIAFKVLNYSFLLKPLMQYYTRQVITQDVEIMQNQGDNLQQIHDQEFKSTEADELHLAIERLRRLGSEGKSEVWQFTKKSEKQFWI